MENLNTDQLVDTLSNLTAPQLVELTKQLESKWGVSATPQVGLSAPPSNTLDAGVAEQTEFNVTMVSFAADKKMAVVKMVREQLGLGLLESKTLVESVPKVVKEGVSKEEAEGLRAKLTEAGATVEVK